MFVKPHPIKPVEAPESVTVLMMVACVVRVGENQHVVIKIIGRTHAVATDYNAPVPAELDIFKGRLEGLVMVEVEFGSEAEAEAFVPPAWFGVEVTADPRYRNSYLSTARWDSATRGLLPL